MATQSRAQQAVDFFSTSIDPLAGARIAPALLNNLPVAINNLSIEATFIVGADATLVGEKVTQQSGLILWQTNYGVQNIFLMGFVKQNTAAVLASFDSPLPQVQNDTAGSNIVTPLITAFTYLGETALPFSSSGATQHEFEISPNLNQLYSQVQLFSQTVSAINNTIATGTADLNGVWTISAIADTRGNLSCPTDGSQVYAPTALTQSAVTVNSGIRNVKGSTGVVSVLGPDVNYNLSSPSAQSSDTPASGWTTFPIVGTGLPTTQISLHLPISTSAIKPYCMKAVWIAPTMFTPTLAPVSLIGVDPQLQIFNPANAPINIAETDCFDFRVSYNWNIENVGGVGLCPPNGVAMYLQAYHVFATCNEDGSCSYHGVNELVDLFQPVSQQSTSAATDSISEYAAQANTLRQRWLTPRFDSTSFTTQGKYMGTLITVCASLANGQAGVAFANFYLNQFSIDVKARQVYRFDQMPTRILRWDNMSPGSNIRIEGSGLFQAVQNTSTQQTNKNVTNTPMVGVDLQLIALLGAIYNYNPACRRSYAMDEYQELLQRLRSMDQNRIALFIGQHPSVVAAMEAAGFFSGLRDLAGRAVSGASRLAQGVGRAALMGGAQHLISNIGPTAQGILFGDDSEQQNADGCYDASGLRAAGANPALYASQSDFMRRARTD